VLRIGRAAQGVPLAPSLDALFAEELSTSVFSTIELDDALFDGIGVFGLFLLGDFDPNRGACHVRPRALGAGGDRP
jgi:hypothetical protein